MLFLNSDEIVAEKARCSPVASTYFARKGISQLGIHGEDSLFLVTEKFLKLLETAPEEIKKMVTMISKEVVPEEGGDVIGQTN